jgi:hypothetical protein
VRPRRPGPNDGGGPKLFKTEAFAGGGFVPSIEPLCPLTGIVFRRLEIEVLDILAHLAAEADGLVVQRAPDEGITNGPSIFAYLVFGPGEKPARRLYEARKAQHTDLE